MKWTISFNMGYRETTCVVMIERPDLGLDVIIRKIIGYHPSDLASLRRWLIALKKQHGPSTCVFDKTQLEKAQLITRLLGDEFEISVIDSIVAMNFEWKRNELHEIFDAQVLGYYLLSQNRFPFSFKKRGKNEN